MTSHVQKLERQLRDALLDRLPSGVQVTEEGARLIPHAEDVLAAAARLTTVSERRDCQIAGTVRIVAPESLCTYRLPSLVSAIREVEPNIDIWLGPGGIGHAVDTVQRGRADLGLTMEPRLPQSDLQTESLGVEPLVFVGGDSEPRGARLTWADLARRDALLIEESCGYSDDVAAKLKATGAPTGRRSHFGSIESIKQCIAVALGWTALPAISAVEQIESGQLHVLDGPTLPDCEVHTLTRPRRHLGPAVSVVLEHLRGTWV